MKITTTTTATFFALFLLSAIISATADPIYDTDDTQLLNGGVYHILPLSSIDEGIMYGKTGGEDCPVSVVLAPARQLSKPVKISSPIGTATIYERLNLEIAFRHPPPCAPTPSFWSLVSGLQRDPRTLSVKLSGIYEDTVEGWFQIARHPSGSGYQIKFYPNRDIHHGPLTLRVKTDRRGQDQLVATYGGEPLIVAFKRAGNHLDDEYAHHDA